MKRDYSPPAELVQAPAVVEVRADESAAVVCTLCGGPARLCGGVRRCTGGAGSPLVLRWLTAIRAVHAGLVLTRTPAALWGGALLRFAHLLASREAAPPGIEWWAGEHANPRTTETGDTCAVLALAYLTAGDLDRLSDLSRLLRRDPAPWIVDLVHLGARAALSTPLDRERFALFATLCEDCASPAAPLEDLYENVGTYDDAIRCPRCDKLPAHPLPGVRIGDPHPVGRCLSSAGPAARTCITHDGGDVDDEGLCTAGRAILDRALVEFSTIERVSTAYERDLVRALVRARRRAANAAVDDAALARALVTSPELMPFFAALAAAHPEVGRDLAQIAGAPLDPEAADPGVRAAISAGGGLAGVIAAGRAALESLRESMLRKPRPTLARSRPRSRRRRQTRSEQ